MKKTRLRSKPMMIVTLLRLLLVITLVSSMFMGCASDSSSRVGKTAAGGAAIGAGIGLLVGAISGDAEVAARAALIGAGAGAAQGAYEGWKQEQDDQRTRQITAAIRESKQSGAHQPGENAETRAREELTRFLGTWTMEGWFEAPGEGRHNVQARVNGDIEMNYFIELAYIDLKVTGVDSQIWGTSTLGYDKDDGYSLSTRLNTLPEPLRSAGGVFDQSSRAFMFKGPDYRLNIRFTTPDRFTVETFVIGGGGERQVESYTFTRT